MANLMGGLVGAGTGWATGGPIGAALGGISGLFGGGPSISPEQRVLLNLQKNAAKDLRAYSQGVPLSDPMERAALASQRGLLGQQQRSVMGNLFSNLGAAGGVAPMDMMGNLTTMFQGQQAGLMGQALQNSLQARRSALLQSAQVAAGALPAAQPRDDGFNLGSVLGQLGQLLMYRRGLQQAQPGGGQQTPPATVYGAYQPPMGKGFIFGR